MQKLRCLGKLRGTLGAHFRFLPSRCPCFLFSIEVLLYARGGLADGLCDILKLVFLSLGVCVVLSVAALASVCAILRASHTVLRSGVFTRSAGWLLVHFYARQCHGGKC
ncbi:hypothetical protein P171DRAFT_157040 [Karstenula rhodostoma CBS 690.94]|uniref:Uncharacterized protein n=1 Tax=Karstenula rhodostoma CBS 690.94 TaxID=1392251 RepID=A0A9P4P8J0_9PLEO|nr:hypothetical protein P171DRAFT_157040 [Karstenula rhodostoma CBS 690.94]